VLCFSLHSSLLGLNSINVADNSKGVGEQKRGERERERKRERKRKKEREREREREKGREGGRRREMSNCMPITW
jgi:hypothetical protein